jgi:chromosome segregation ATPase
MLLLAAQVVKGQMQESNGKMQQHVDNMQQQIDELLAQSSREIITALEREVTDANTQLQTVVQELERARADSKKVNDDRNALEQVLQESMRERDAAAKTADEEMKQLLLRCEVCVWRLLVRVASCSPPA